MREVGKCIIYNFHRHKLNIVSCLLSPLSKSINLMGDFMAIVMINVHKIYLFEFSPRQHVMGKG